MRALLLLLALTADTDWPVSSGPYNIRYTTLSQITPANVSRLQLAWSYDAHDAFKDSEMQSNPIVVDGILYATTPKLRVIAIDAAHRPRRTLELRPRRRRTPNAASATAVSLRLSRPRLLHPSQLPLGPQQEDRPAHPLFRQREP